MERQISGQDAEIRADKKARTYRLERYGDIDSVDQVEVAPKMTFFNYDVVKEASNVAMRWINNDIRGI